jgi:hypothetical protein
MGLVLGWLRGWVGVENGVGKKMAVFVSGQRFGGFYGKNDPRNL